MVLWFKISLLKAFGNLILCSNLNQDMQWRPQYGHDRLQGQQYLSSLVRAAKMAPDRERLTQLTKVKI